jgi:hypothetical protein
MSDDELIKRLRSLDVNVRHAAADRIEQLATQLKMVLEREAETHRRHEAREDTIREAALREAFEVTRTYGLETGDYIGGAHPRPDRRKEMTHIKYPDELGRPVPDEPDRQPEAMRLKALLHDAMVVGAKAEAKLAKAVAALRAIKEEARYDTAWSIACGVLEIMEETE